MPDGDRGRIIAWLTRICIQADASRWFFGEQGLRIESYRKGNARADAGLAPRASAK
ncbi:hypothetical protein [Streptomyces sp. NPDC059166]|uniref:hypothetical protein n=1 Tax=Streptomyces sp. NPDC059166 TaxID=3346752 RepID=UPI003679FE20